MEPMIVLGDGPETYRVILVLDYSPITQTNDLDEARRTLANLQALSEERSVAVPSTNVRDVADLILQRGNHAT